MADVGRTRPMEQGQNPLPTSLHGKMRADFVVAEAMRNRKELPDMPPETIRSLSLPKAKPEGITIEVNQEDRLILVRFEGNIVAVLKWAASQGKFHVKRRVNYRENIREKLPVEYFCDLVDMWTTCAEYGVTLAEFQQAFHEMPPTVEWNFSDCPWQSMECSLVYKGDPRDTAIPDIACRRCEARFGMDQNGVLTLKSQGFNPIVERAVEPAAGHLQPPAPPRVPFEKDFPRYHGLGKAKLEQLLAAGIDSWDKVQAAGVDGLRVAGLEGKAIEIALELAAEKLGG